MMRFLGGRLRGGGLGVSFNYCGPDSMFSSEPLLHVFQIGIFVVIEMGLHGIMAILVWSWKCKVTFSQVSCDIYILGNILLFPCKHIDIISI